MSDPGDYFWEMRESRQERWNAYWGRLDRQQGIPPHWSEEQEEESTTEEQHDEQ